MDQNSSQPSSAAPLRIGEVFVSRFRFSQKDVDDFVTVSGDPSIIHQNEAAALRSPMRAKGIPGFLSAMIFSRVLGTIFPGHKTVYVSQSLQFKRPVELEKEYEAVFKVLEINPAPPKENPKPGEVRLPRATISTNIIESGVADPVTCLAGVAVVVNQDRIVLPESSADCTNIEPKTVAVYQS